MAELDRILRAAGSAGTSAPPPTVPRPPAPKPIPLDKPLSEILEDMRKKAPTPGLPTIPVPKLPGTSSPTIPMPRLPTTPRAAPPSMGDLRAWDKELDAIERATGEPIVPSLSPRIKPKSKGFSLGRELSSAWKGSVGGLWQFAQMFPGTAIGTGMAAKDLVTGDWDQLDGLFTGDNEDIKHYYGGLSQFAEGLTKGGENLGKLFAGSEFLGGRVTAVARDLGWQAPEDYQEKWERENTERYVGAYREGRMLDEFLTDLGMTVAVTGAAASAARGAGAVARLRNTPRASGFAARAERAATALDDVSYRADWSDPVTAASRLVKGQLRRVLRRPTNRLREAVGKPRLNKRAEELATQHGILPLLEEQVAGRSVTNIMDELVNDLQWEVEGPRNITDTIGVIARDSKLTAPQRRLVTLVASGSYKQVFKAIWTANAKNPNLGRALLNAWNERLRDKPESMWLTMDDVDAAKAYFDRTMPAEQLHALETGVAAMQGFRGKLTGLKVEKNRLDPEQLQRPLAIRDDQTGAIIGVENDMMTSRVEAIADKLNTELTAQGKVVEELEGKEARTSQEYASQSLSVAAMGPPGTRGVDSDAVRERSKVLAQNYQRLREEVRNYEVKLAGITDEWNQMKRKIAQTESNGNEAPADWARRENELQQQIIHIEAQLSDLRSARDQIGHADEVAPDLRGMDDESAVAAVAQEYADVLRDATQHEYDAMRQVGGVPSRTAVESVAHATGQEGRTYGGKYEADEYAEFGALSDTGVNVHDFGARLRSHFPEFAQLTDGELMEQYFETTDILMDLKNNDLADINAVVQPIAKYLDMEPAQIKAALRGGWTEQMGEASLDVLDQVRQLYTPELENTTGIPGFDIENALRAHPEEVREYMDRIIETFDQLLAERGMMGGGAAARAVVNKLTPEQMIGWIAHNRIPQQLKDMLQSGELLGDYQIGAMHKAVEYMRAVRRDIATGRREDILQGREHVAEQIDARELELVERFNERLGINNYDDARRINPPEISASDLPAMRQLRDEAAEIRGRDGDDARGHLEDNLTNAGLAVPQFSTAQLGATILPNKVWLRLMREGWLGNANPRSRTVTHTNMADGSKYTEVIKPMAHGTPADVFASRWKGGKFAGDMEAALLDYVKDVREVWAKSRLDQDHIVQELADRHGLDREVIYEALDGSRADFETEYRASVEAKFTDAVDALEGQQSKIIEALQAGDGLIAKNQLYLANEELFWQLRDLVSDWDTMAQYLGDQLALRSKLPMVRPPMGPPIREGMSGNEALVRERAVLGEEMATQLPAAYKLADQARQRTGEAKRAAEQGEQDYRLAAAATPEGYWEPGENGELAPGVAAAVEMGATGQRLKDIRSELAWERKKHDRLRQRVNTLEPTLRRSQQDTLRAIDRRAIDKIVRIAAKLSKRPLGGIEFIEPKRPGEMPYYKITGTIRDVAEKLGITKTMYEILEARPGRMGPLKQTPAQAIGVMGQTSPSLEILYEAIAATDTWDLLTGEIRQELAMSIIADDIQRSVMQPVKDDISLLRLDIVETDTLYRIEQAARKHEGISSREGRIELGELGPKVGNDFVSEVRAAFDEARMKRAHELKMVNDPNVNVMTATYARVARLGRHQLTDHLALAGELFAESRVLIDRLTHMEPGPAYDRIRALAEGKRAEAEWIARAAEEIPTSTLQMLQAGINPTHMKGGSGLPLSASRGSGRSSSRLADKAISSEMQMRQGHIEPDLDNYTRQELADAMEFMQREVIKTVAQNPELSMSMYELLADEIAIWRDRNNTQAWPPDAELNRLTRAMGFEPVGRRPGRQGQGPAVEGGEEWGILSREDLPPEKYNMEDGGPRVIHKTLADAIRDYMDYSPGRIGRNWDALNAIWKIAVLPLRPLWWIGNLFGNSLMTMAGTGTNWVGMPTLAAEMANTLKINKARMEQLMNGEMSWWEFRKALIAMGGQLPAMPNRLRHNGLSHQDYAGLSSAAEPDFLMGRAVKLLSDPEYVAARRDPTNARQLGRTRAATLGIISRLAEFGYRMNELGDNLFRNTLYNIELDKRLPDGITPEDVHLGKVKITPEIQTMMDESVSRSLGALGDFSRLTPNERRYFKRIFPFYPWLRHQVRISLLMPIYSPLRAAFLNVVYDIMVDEEDQQRGWMEAFGTSIDTPFGKIPLRSANPFATLESNVLFSGEGLRSVSPFIGLGIETFSPLDLGQAASRTRPMDQADPGLYGGGEPMSPAERWWKDPKGALGEFGYSAAGLTPQTGLLRDAALSALPGTGFRGEGSRPFNASSYDSGDVSPYPAREGGTLAKIAQGLGIPFPSSQPMYEQRVRLQDAARRARGG